MPGLRRLAMFGVVSALGGMGSRRRKRSVWVIASLTIWIVIGGQAVAAESEPSTSSATDSGTPPPADRRVHRREDGLWSIPLSMTSVGAEGLRMAGEVGQTRIVLPVPPGLEPVVLLGQVHRSADVETGFLEYSAEGTGTRSLTLDESAGGEASQPVELDLDGAIVRNSSVGLELDHRLRAVNSSCDVTLVGSWAELEGEVLLQGEPEAPATVAQFPTALLSRLVIQVPPAVSYEEAHAAAKIALALARSSLSGVVDVVVVDEDDDRVDAQRDPLTTRVVVVDTDRLAGARLGDSDSVPTLYVGGSGSSSVLSETSTLLDGDLAPLATSSTAVPGVSGARSEVDQPVPGSTRTFASLGLARAIRSGLGRMELGLNVGQTDFGGPVKRLSVHLEVTHTAVPEGARGSLSVAVNGLFVDSAPLSGEARTVLDFDMDRADVGRDTTIQVTVDFTPAHGECQPEQVPFSWQVDYIKSTITTRGGQGLAPGFARFPQVLVPGFSVGLDRLDSHRLQLAIGLLATLQRTAGRRLVPDSFASVDQVLERQAPGVLVTATTTSFLESRPLVATNPLRVADSSVDQARLSLDQVGPSAYLQAYQGLAGVDYLALTWQDGGQESGMNLAAELVSSLTLVDFGFRQLFGDVYIVSAEAPATSISLTGASAQETPVRAAPSYTTRSVAIIFLAGAVGLSIVFGGWWRRRKGQPSKMRPKAMTLGRGTRRRAAPQLVDQCAAARLEGFEELERRFPKAFVLMRAEATDPVPARESTDQQG